MICVNDDVVIYLTCCKAVLCKTDMKVANDDDDDDDSAVHSS